MNRAGVGATADEGEVMDLVRRYWGFDQLRPLQQDAIRAGIERRDSLVVMPTGGGKSLCYQVPPLRDRRTDVVVSPLISLMKDQVDGLRECGYAAVALHSGLSPADWRAAQADVAAGRVRLLFVAPERLVAPAFLGQVERWGVRAFAIDEAHCISHWGHDFRPEYRRLAILKERFPQASVHAFTATATQRVRDDIVAQLRLQDPVVLIGRFDRPNLIYRVVPRTDVSAQVLAAIQRHAHQAVIVYCLSRRDTEDLAAYLQSQQLRAAFYHAGMDADQRRRTQDEFAAERIDVIVATVAFGMGIDRSDVRCVIHACMPKSVEHYQQETGRAGRDGLEAECVLFYSAADALRLKALIAGNAETAEGPDTATAAALELLGHMRRYCASPRCRHRALSEYFGQPYEAAHCGACDVCLHEREGLADATVTAQKILSCVARVGERFGVGYVVEVLLGARSPRITSLGHDRLSTFGLLKGTVNKKELTSLVYQLLDQGLLERAGDEYPIVRLNAAAREVLRGQRTVSLPAPARKPPKKARVEQEAWEGVDRGLFESLRELRREIAQQRDVAAFVIFGDATLRDLARRRPGSPSTLATVRGIGEKKATDLGPRFLARIAQYCREQRLPLDPPSHAPRSPPPGPGPSAAKRHAFELFAEGRPIEQVMTAVERARSTVCQYLADYIVMHAPRHIDCWVDRDAYQRVVTAATQTGSERLKPIFDQLEGTVPYDTVRLVVTHLSVQGCDPV